MENLDSQIKKLIWSSSVIAQYHEDPEDCREEERSSIGSISSADENDLHFLLNGAF